MAGPNIPRWQAQQGVQAGAMGQAYDRAGALFGKVLESAQGILDQKIENESVPFMESMLTAENTDDLAAARESGLENKWADQAKLGAANIAQTKELKQQERDAASAAAAAEMAEREYVLKAEDLDRKIRDDIARNEREWAKINKMGRSGGGGAGGTSAQKEAAEFQLASYLHSSPLFVSRDENARDTARTSYQAAAGPDATSGNISEAVLSGNVNAFMDQKERELYLTALGDYAQRAGVPPDERIAAGLREQAQKTLAPERAAALKYANVYSTEGMAALRGKENAFISQTPIRGTANPFARNTSADATVLAKTIRSVLDPEDAHTVYDTIPAPTDFDQVKQVAPVIYGTLTDAIIRQMSAQYPPEAVSKLEQYARTEIEGKGFDSLNDVTVKVAKFRQEEAQIKLNHLLSKDIEKEEETWGVGNVPAKRLDAARALLVEGISAEMGETPEALGLIKNKIDRKTHDPVRTEGLKSVFSKQYEALEEEKKLDPLLELIQGR